MDTSKKARLSVDCSIEERRLIKMLATSEDKTISEYLLDLARTKMSKLASLHMSSSKDERSTEESLDGSDNFWNSLGFGA
jgi:hypothetical protein